MFDTTHIMITVRQILLMVGPMLVARGIIDQGSLAALVDNAMTAISAIIVIVTLVWGHYRERKGPSDKVPPPPGH